MCSIIIRLTSGNILQDYSASLHTAKSIRATRKNRREKKGREIRDPRVEVWQSSSRYNSSSSQSHSGKQIVLLMITFLWKGIGLVFVETLTLKWSRGNRKHPPLTAALLHYHALM